MATTNLGKVSVTPKGEYDPLVTYERLDVISHNGSSYIVKQASTGVTPIEGEFYALIAEKGDGGSFVKKAYKTYAAMDADKVNIPANSSVDVTNDLDESKNGAYIYDGVAFTRSQYDSKVVTDKIIADTAIAVQDAISNTVLSSGFVTIDSFELGATITQRNQALRHTADGKLYRWAGDLPKTVPTGSSPLSSGGLGANAWFEVSDVVLRQELSQNDGALLVGGASVTYSSIAKLIVSNAKTVGKIIQVVNYHEDSSGGGGSFVWMPSVSKSKHNGGTIIDPDKSFPTDWNNKGDWFDATGTGTGVYVRLYNKKLLLASWFGCKADQVTDDSSAINKAIQVKPALMFDSDGTYLILEPIVVTNAGEGLIVKGISRDTTRILKPNTTAPNITRVYGAETYNYNTSCIFALVAADDNYVRQVYISDIRLRGDEGYNTLMFEAPRITYAFLSNIDASKTLSFYRSYGLSWIVNFKDVRSSQNQAPAWNVHGGNAYTLSGCYANSGSGDSAGANTGYDFTNCNVTLTACDTDGTNIGYKARGGGTMTLVGCFTESRLRLVSATDTTIVNVYGGKFQMSIIGSQENSQQFVFEANDSSTINVFGARVTASNFTTNPTPANKYLARTYGAGKAKVLLNDVVVDKESLLGNKPLLVSQSDGSITVVEGGLTINRDVGIRDVLTSERKSSSKINTTTTNPVFAEAGKHLIYTIGVIGYNTSLIADLDIDIYADDGASGAYTAQYTGNLKITGSNRGAPNVQFVELGTSSAPSSTDNTTLVVTAEISETNELQVFMTTKRKYEYTVCTVVSSVNKIASGKYTV